MTLIFRQATPDDLDPAMALLRESAAWMHRQGHNGWPAAGFPASRVGPWIAEGSMWMTHHHPERGGGLVGTLCFDQDPDPEFQAAEMDPAAENAIIVHKLATVRPGVAMGSGYGPPVPRAGHLMLEWACDRAARLGARWVWLNVARAATGLQAYYAAAGFDHVTTVRVGERRSGSIWRRLAAPSEAAAQMASPAALESER